MVGVHSTWARRGQQGTSTLAATCAGIALGGTAAILLMRFVFGRPVPAPKQNTAGEAGGRILFLSVTVRVKPSRREEFIRCIKANQKATLATEPLAVSYEIGESTTEKNTWHFQESYRGRAGFEAHLVAPHFKAWEAFTDTDPFTAKTEVDFFEQAL